MTASPNCNKLVLRPLGFLTFRHLPSYIASESSFFTYFFQRISWPTFRGSFIRLATIGIDVVSKKNQNKFYYFFMSWKQSLFVLVLPGDLCIDQVSHTISASVLQKIPPFPWNSLGLFRHKKSIIKYLTCFKHYYM